MFIVSWVILWYLVWGASWLLNRFVTKAKFFNHGYLYLALCLILAAPSMVVSVMNGDIEGGVIVAMAWVIPAVVGYFVGKRFVRTSPFSFPSVLWSRKSAA